ncbi:MAG: PASTA domain-containing protein [Spirochaetia bacterium]|nr:PASTA domain-containing protein [Spirochaetia bacterium]
MDKEKTGFILKVSFVGFILFFVTAALVMRVIFSISTIYMPDFTGLKVEKAQKQAARMKIDLKIEDEQFSNVYEQGMIITQDIKPKTQIKKGRVVYVVVSKGSKLVLVPDITNSLKSKAIVDLKNTGLIEGSTAAIRSNIYKENIVIAQSPAPGEEIPAGMPMNLLYSSGERERDFLMPNFTGRTIFDSFELIKTNKLMVEKLIVEENSGLESGVILSQSPGAGYMVNNNTPITLKASINESDERLKKRIIHLSYVNPAQVPQLIKITVLSLNGSDTIFSEVAEPGQVITLSTAVRGNALVQIYNGTGLAKEMEF